METPQNPLASDPRVRDGRARRCGQCTRWLHLGGGLGITDHFLGASGYKSCAAGSRLRFARICTYATAERAIVPDVIEKPSYIGLDYDTGLAVPVYGGYALPRAILRLAGRDLAKHFVKILTGRGCSFSAAAEREIVPNVMEKPSYIGLDYDTELKSIAKKNKTKTFERPDRNIISVGAERFHSVERLFQPSFSGKEASGFHNTSFKCNTKCDADIRKNLYPNVVSSGDTAIFLHEGGLGIMRSILILLSELFFF